MPPLPASKWSFIVYCPGLYEVRNNTGKRFRYEYQAVQFIRDCRNAGHMAWLETDGNEVIDA